MPKKESPESNKIFVAKSHIERFRGRPPKHVYLSPAMAIALKRDVFGGATSLAGREIHGLRVHVVMSYEPEYFLVTMEPI
jgi:hypothetical protein